MQLLSANYDVAVVGAGPAGLAAAAACARAGLSTALFDEQAHAGGQIYRAVGESSSKLRAILGKSYARGAVLLDQLRASGARHVAAATVWSLTREREIGVSVGGAAQLTTARRVILCTGALERPFPIEGWTLPGVMGAGAAQILLKSSGIVARGRTVLAGCGPLLWLTAAQYLRAGASIEAILDTTARGARASSLPHLPAFLLSPYFAEGLALLRAVRRHVRVISGVTALRAIGRDRLETIGYATGGAEATLAADALFLHQGVAPNVNLAMSVGIEHRWDDAQLCWNPMLDEDGSSSVDGIAIAGDGAGIAGAQAAEARGRLAAVAAIRALGGHVAADDERQARRALAAALRGRTFLDTLYRPAQAFRRPTGDVVVCRCEEVTARQIADTAALGCPGPNQMKSFLRCGMGPCQGRLCGLTVTELMAQAHGVSPQAIGYYRLRPPVKPISVGELAALHNPAAT